MQIAKCSGFFFCSESSQVFFSLSVISFRRRTTVKKIAFHLHEIYWVWVSHSLCLLLKTETCSFWFLGRVCCWEQANREFVSIFFNSLVSPRSRLFHSPLCCMHESTKRPENLSNMLIDRLNTMRNYDTRMSFEGGISLSFFKNFCLLNE